ncbi:unnamed protein product, partial [Nesidiocoris tenuis]
TQIFPIISRKSYRRAISFKSSGNFPFTRTVKKTSIYLMNSKSKIEYLILAVERGKLLFNSMRVTEALGSPAALNMCKSRRLTNCSQTCHYCTYSSNSCNWSNGQTTRNFVRPDFPFLARVPEGQPSSLRWNLLKSAKREKREMKIKLDLELEVKLKLTFKLELKLEWPEMLPVRTVHGWSGFHNALHQPYRSSPQRMSQVKSENLHILYPKIPIFRLLSVSVYNVRQSDENEGIEIGVGTDCSKVTPSKTIRLHLVYRRRSVEKKGQRERKGIRDRIIPAPEDKVVVVLVCSGERAFENEDRLREETFLVRASKRKRKIGPDRKLSGSNWKDGILPRISRASDLDNYYLHPLVAYFDLGEKRCPRLELENFEKPGPKLGKVN